MSEHVIWKVQANGRRALNGPVYGVTLHGDAILQPPHNLHDAVSAVAKGVVKLNREMEIVEDIQITVSRRRRS